MRYTDGRAWIVGCGRPDCAAAVIEAHVYGIKLELSTWSVPWRDALALMRYERIIINVREMAGKLYAEYWQPPYGPPDVGRLYARHIHGISGRRLQYGSID